MKIDTHDPLIIVTLKAKTFGHCSRSENSYKISHYHTKRNVAQFCAKKYGFFCSICLLRNHVNELYCSNSINCMSLKWAQIGISDNRSIKNRRNIKFSEKTEITSFRSMNALIAALLHYGLRYYLQFFTTMIANCADSLLDHWKRQMIFLYKDFYFWLWRQKLSLKISLLPKADRTSCKAMR